MMPRAFVVSFLSLLVMGMFFYPASRAHAVLYNASNLLGQNDTDGTPFYNDSTYNGSATQQDFNHPINTALDSANHRLFVTDQDDYRVLVYQLDSTNNIATTSAAHVIGQPDFVTNTPGTLTSSTIGKPYGVAYDSANQRLFVADMNFQRVLVFNVATSTIHDGEGADHVIGQSNFVTHITGTTSSTFRIDGPEGIAYDPESARLFATDRFNARVLIFNVATSTIHDGEGADHVLGAPDLSSYDGNLTQSGITDPVGVEYDTAGRRAFVSDSNGGRVLIFNVATSTVHDGELADQELGEPDFQTNNLNTTQRDLSTVSGMAYDSTYNRLFVGDDGNGRVMVFDVATSTVSTTAELAENDLGQSNYTSFRSAVSQNQFNNTNSFLGLTYDPTYRRLFVVDPKSNRVMLFNFITITNSSLAQGTTSVAYSQTLLTTSTQGAISFLMKSGSLPTGLSFATSTGVISGTPTVATTSNVFFEADDTFTTGAFFDRSLFSLSITTGGGGGGGGSPAISLAPTSLTYTATAGNSSSNEGTQNVTVTNSGAAVTTLNWSAASSQSWLTVSPTSGSLATGATTSIGFSVSALSLSVGTYHATGTITDSSASNSPQTVSVTATVSAASSGGGSSVSSQAGGGGAAYYVIANHGVATTTSSVVDLELYGTGAYTMQVSSVPTFDNASWMPYITSMMWPLAPQLGTQNLYVRFRTVRGMIIGSATSSITLVPIVKTIQVPNIPASLVTPTQVLAPSSSPVFPRNLGWGMTGDDVRELQLFLIKRNSGFAAQKLSRHGATKTFGILTYDALIGFQKSINIKPASGYFGSITRAYVNASI